MLWAGFSNISTVSEGLTGSKFRFPYRTVTIHSANQDFAHSTSYVSDFSQISSL